MQIFFQCAPSLLSIQTEDAVCTVAWDLTICEMFTSVSVSFDSDRLWKSLCII